MSYIKPKSGVLRIICTKNCTKENGHFLSKDWILDTGIQSFFAKKGLEFEKCRMKNGFLTDPTAICTLLKRAFNAIT